jgi:hypothetical protein
MIRCPAAGGLALLVLFHPLRGSAQTSSTDVAIATQLFDDAEKLVAAGNPDAACPKYRESQRRDPQLGTLLHLADCWEEIGKTASAWAAFKEAAEVAARRNASGLNEPREKTARARVAALEKRLARLTINVVNAGTPGLEIRQGGELVDRALWGSAVPIDPGVYTLTAHAPGKKQWTQMLEVDAEGGAMEVAVPLLENESQSMPMVASPAPTSSSRRMDAAESPATPMTSGNAQRTTGLVLGGVGVATLGVGAVFGLMSNAKASDSEAICPSGVDCTPDDVQQVRGLEGEARDHAMRFNVASGIGAALLIGGAILTLTAPSTTTAKPPLALRIETWGGTAAMGANLSGRW